MQDRTDYNKLKKSEFFKEYMLIKTDPIKYLYDEYGYLSVFATKDGELMKFDISLKCINEKTNKTEPDCSIENFDLNLYVRTMKGRKGETYTNLESMLKDIEKELTKKPIVAKAEYYTMSFEKDNKHPVSSNE